MIVCAQQEGEKNLQHLQKQKLLNTPPQAHPLQLQQPMTTCRLQGQHRSGDAENIKCSAVLQGDVGLPVQQVVDLMIHTFHDKRAQTC